MATKKTTAKKTTAKKVETKKVVEPTAKKVEPKAAAEEEVQLSPTPTVIVDDVVSDIVEPVVGVGVEVTKVEEPIEEEKPDEDFTGSKQTGFTPKMPELKNSDRVQYGRNGNTTVKRD